MLIFNKILNLINITITNMSESILPHEKELISDIKDKQELRTLDEDFVKNKLDVFFKSRSHEQAKEKFLRKLNDSKTYKQFTKSREYKFLIKEIRAELRRVYGVFIMEGYNKRIKLLEELKQAQSEEEILEIHEKLLLLHKSTKERMQHYDELYETIFDTINDFEKDEKEKKILDNKNRKDSKDRFVFMDLACGMNPISSVYFKEKIIKYYASDISTEDCEFLKDYFDTTQIDAIIFPADLTDEKVIYKLEKIKVDICFIFKTLDGLERIKRNISLELMKNISTKYFAVTFPTVSISGTKDIAMNKRAWFENMLTKLEWPFEKFDISQELLYVIKKK